MKIIRSLLIVDDNPGDVELTTLVFERTGRYPHVFSAPHGEAVVALFEGDHAAHAAHPGVFPPDLVLLDINMPRMSGFDVLEAFEARPALVGDTQVIVMHTSSTDPADRERAARLGVTEFLVKPATAADAIRLADRYGVEADA